MIWILILVLITAAAGYLLYRLIAHIQTMRWERDGKMPDLHKLRFGCLIFWLLGMICMAIFLNLLADFPAQR